MADLRIAPGQLSTTLHPTAISDVEGQSAYQCSRDRGVFERTRGYRKIDPAKSPNPVQDPPQGATGFGFWSYQGVEIFLLSMGDAIYESLPSTSQAFLERQDSASASLMHEVGSHVENLLHDGTTSIHQVRESAYAANVEGVKKWSRGAIKAFEKTYDTSVYSKYYSLSPNYDRETLADPATDMAPTVTGGHSPTVAFVDDGRLILSDSGSGTSKVACVVTLTKAALTDIPAGTGWFAIPVVLQNNTTHWPGYGEPDDQTLVNSSYRDYRGRMQTNLDPFVSFLNGTDVVIAGTYFLEAGNTMWLFCEAASPDIFAGGVQYDSVELQIHMWWDDDPGGEVTIGPIYWMGEPMALQDNPDFLTSVNLPLLYNVGHGEAPLAQGQLAGPGPDFSLTDPKICYALRGCNAGETVFGDPVFVQVASSLLYDQGFFTDKATMYVRIDKNLRHPSLFNIGVRHLPNAQGLPFFTQDASPPIIASFVDKDRKNTKIELSTYGTTPFMPNLVVLSSPDILLDENGDAYDKVQVLRSPHSGINEWYRLGLVDNDGSGQLTDNNAEIDGELLFPRTFYSNLFNDQRAPIVDHVQSGCEWKGHNVFGGDDGWVFFSAQDDATSFIWRDYIEGGDLESSSARPRSIQVAGDAEPILAVHGSESVFILSRRHAWFMSGATAATASGPYKVSDLRGTLGPFSSCQSAGGLLVGTDEGLMFVAVNPNNLGQAGDVTVQNVTLASLRSTWDWLMGTSSEREAMTIAEAAGHIWCVCGTRAMYRSPRGLWNTADLASSVVRAVSDGLHRIAFAFSDGSIGFVSDFPAYGGIEPDGLDGIPIRWTYRSKRFAASAMPRRVDAQQDSSEPSQVSVRAFRGEFSEGVVVDLEGEKNNVAFPIDGGQPQGNVRCIEIEVSGGPYDVVTSVSVELSPIPDGRAIR